MERERERGENKNMIKLLSNFQTILNYPDIHKILPVFFDVLTRCAYKKKDFLKFNNVSTCSLIVFIKRA